MARDRRQRDGERLGQLADGRIAAREPGEDRAARRIGKRGERGADGVHGRNVVLAYLTVKLNNRRIRSRRIYVELYMQWRARDTRTARRRRCGVIGRERVAPGAVDMIS